MIYQKTLTMITHRSIEEGVAMEIGKFSSEYFKACSIIEMNDLDMLQIGIEEKSPVKVVSECGEVVVTAIVGKQELPKGVCHIRQGIWANQIVPCNTFSTGVPQYSGFPVTVTPAPGTPVRSARDLLYESVGMRRIDAQSS